ncbi:vWA domain-containing protein [Caloramator sp.]|uniref:vWA domain-containing protein n=1 Tax=Caloramator sp. TaxID=1871330 RepID=UPI0025BAACB3|nr:vWA domain-containing protein [Caloramator sp.]
MKTLKKRILALVLVLAIVLGIGWSRMTKASGVKEFSAKILTQSEIIRVGEEVELQFNYKINGQGNNISNICITYPIPANFEVSTLPDRWNIVVNTLKGNDLNFNPNGSISFSVKLKSKSLGKLENFGTATLTYNYNKGNDKTKEVTSETLTDQVKLFNRVSNAPLSSLIIDPTNINIEANIKNKRTDNGNSYLYLDDPIEVEYKLTPQGEINVDRKPVDIVLVVDNSGSMQEIQNGYVYKYIIKEFKKYKGGYNFNNPYKIYYTNLKEDKEYYNNREIYDYHTLNWFYYKSFDNPYFLKTKMYSTILAAKNLINKIYDESISNGKDDKVAIYGFNYRVTNPNDTLLGIRDINNKNNLIEKIDSMYGAYQTNIHDGLLVAKNSLNADNRDAEKHIIVLTDGMPNLYMYDDNVYSGETKAKQKVLEEIDNIKNMGYKVHFIGLDTENGAISTSFFSDIEKKESGISKIIKSTEELQPLYNEIYQAITKSVVYSEFKFEQNLPEKLQVEEVYVNGTKLDSTQYSIVNGKLIVGLDSIVFENKKGTPPPLTINVKYKSNDTGVINLNEAIISGQKLVEGSSYNYTNSCQIGSIEIRPRDFYNYVNFNNIEVNRSLIPNNTYVTVKVDITNKQLFNMDSNAKVELILTPITDGGVEAIKDSQQNNFIYNASAESKSDRFKFRITDDNVKDKEVTIRITAIKVTYKGVEYNITQDIYKYFGNETPSIPVMVKKFTLR